MRAARPSKASFACFCVVLYAGLPAIPAGGCLCLGLCHCASVSESVSVFVCLRLHLRSAFCVRVCVLCS
eukprot:15450612-Alexandrium_andersonii.AAC.1